MVHPELIDLSLMIASGDHKQVSEKLKAITCPIPPNLANAIGRLFDPDSRKRKLPRTKYDIPGHLIERYYHFCSNEEDAKKLCKVNSKPLEGDIQAALCDMLKNSPHPVNIGSRTFGERLREYNNSAFLYYKSLLSEGLSPEEAKKEASKFSKIPFHKLEIIIRNKSS